MPKVVCVWRGSDEIDNAIEHLDEAKVQLLYSKFPVGSGTFKRNKFIYVQYIGPKCSIVKRGQGINEITNFTTNNIRGVPGFSTTDKASLSFESLVRHMRDTFVMDSGNFSMEQIREEYRERLAAEQMMMHQEREQAAVVAATAKRGRRNTAPSVRLAPKPAPPPTKEERPSSPVEVSAQTNRVMTSLRQDNGSVNWVVFESNSEVLTVRAYGQHGIFEMVKNLPDEEWLFGLFRISFSNGEVHQRRMIFFQWIGSSLKAMRGGSHAGVYPAMAKALSPFNYEIYLVGRQDLNPQAIIAKSKSAFRTPADRRIGVARDFMIDSTVFTEENYRQSLVEEQATAEVFEERPKKTHRLTMPIIPDGIEQSSASVATTGTADSPAAQSFSIEETIDLVQAKEGGLVWAIFEVLYVQRNRTPARHHAIRAHRTTLPTFSAGTDVMQARYNSSSARWRAGHWSMPGSWMSIPQHKAHTRRCAAPRPASLSAARTCLEEHRHPRLLRVHIQPTRRIGPHAAEVNKVPTSRPAERTGVCLHECGPSTDRLRYSYMARFESTVLHGAAAWLDGAALLRRARLHPSAATPGGRLAHLAWGWVHAPHGGVVTTPPQLSRRCAGIDTPAELRTPRAAVVPMPHLPRHREARVVALAAGSLCAALMAPGTGPVTVEDGTARRMWARALALRWPVARASHLCCDYCELEHMTKCDKLARSATAEEQTQTLWVADSATSLRRQADIHRNCTTDTTTFALALDTGRDPRGWKHAAHPGLTGADRAARIRRGDEEGPRGAR
ncbi:hypothetical protein CGC20_6550 [Leishmania donovani]|uniref:ADF-H domain-containing protein n=1 Tax=Leishmania donovani TaxID=5661 RepID=A0A504X2K8_LEIDO|nr:hypothetical protein CGC20_6550 [Leishmania donovani]